MASPVDTCDDSDFEYESVKMAYTEKVNNIFKSKISTWNREREAKAIKTIIRTYQPALLLSLLTIPPENLDNNTKVDIAKENGVPILTLANSNIQIVALEDCFDIFVDLHLRESHAGFDAMYAIFQKYFYFPSTLLLKCFLQSCNVCIKRQSRTSVRSSIIQNPPTPSIIEDNNLNLVVHLMFLGMSFVHPKVKDEFKYMLVYRQEKSGYVLLRPLLELDAEEVALELYNIFVDFGPPETLLTTHLDFLTDVLQLLQMTPIKYNCTVSEGQFDHESLTNKIADYLNEWTNKCNSSNWAAASYIVQFCLNTDGDKPLEKLFGRRDGQSAKICLSREQIDSAQSLASTSKGHSSLGDPSTDPLLTKEDEPNEDTGVLHGEDDDVSDCDSVSLKSLDSENDKSIKGVEGSIKTEKTTCDVCQRPIIFKEHMCTKCNNLIHVFCGLRVAVNPKSFEDCQLICKNCGKSLSEFTE